MFFENRAYIKLLTKHDSLVKVAIMYIANTIYNFTIVQIPFRIVDNQIVCVFVHA